MTISLLLLFHFNLLVFVYCYSGNRYDPLDSASSIQHFTRLVMDNRDNKDMTNEYLYSPVHIGLQDGLKDADKISTLPGQPIGIDFEQYSGYVTIDQNHGKTLFYYLVQSPVNSSTNPLVLWLNGGPACSSVGHGAMTGLGPFRVNPDNSTLSRNNYAWNNVANMLFLESPVGVGFSYSNISSDYEIGDSQTAKDSYTFLVNWLERFPEYKARDFYIAGQNYAGHYIPQLTQLILQNNKIGNKTIINIRGIIVGNAYFDEETRIKGVYDYYWTHAIIPDEIHNGIMSTCNFSKDANISWKCNNFKNKARKARGSINIYDIYGLLCPPDNTTLPVSGFDPCSIVYVEDYLNKPTVQQSFHAKSTHWESCNESIMDNWNDSPFTMLPIVRDLMASGIRVWMYSGDTDARYSVITSKYDIQKLQTTVKTPWYPWMCEGEVGGYAVEYENLTFATVRGAGHSVPSNQPARALTLFTSFLNGKLP